MESRDIVVMGDIHGEFPLLNKFIAGKNISIVLQTGDLGYWPNWSWELWYPNKRNKKYPKKIPTIKSIKTKIYFCDGNHEDHWSLQKLTNNEIFPNTYYMKRGTVFTIPDGRNILFMGGANSYDKATRQYGIDWFPEENISYADTANLDFNTKIDIVISHTCPMEFNIGKHIKGELRENDPNRKILSNILKVFNPSLWYFGHWHTYATGYDNGCRWIALDRIMSGGRWWEYLKS